MAGTALPLASDHSPVYTSLQKSRLPSGFSCSLIQECQVKLAKVLRIGKHIDCNDLPVCNGKVKDDTRMSSGSPYKSNRSVHDRRLCCPGSRRDLPGHVRRTTPLLCS